MLTPEEEAAWDAYVAEMEARGVEVDLIELMNVLVSLQGSAAGRVIADTLGVGTMPIEELAIRLTLQTMRIIQTGQVPGDLLPQTTIGTPFTPQPMPEKAGC